MQKSKVQSVEIAEFCRKSAHHQPNFRVIQAGIGKAVLQGVVLSLLESIKPADSGYSSVRSNPWI